MCFPHLLLKRHIGERREQSMSHNQPQVSFEFFPPKSAELEASLWQAIEQLAPLGPRFVSVTYGAGGTTRERTHALVARIRRDTALEPAAHLTCVGANRDEIDTIAREYWQAGVRHIVALRGDAPKDQPHYVPHPQGYAYADDLTIGLRAIADFEISVAAYPETHPEASSPQADIDHLKRKVDAGATRAITQYFFDIAHYERFMDKLAKAGISIEVTPGVLPIGNYAQMVRFSAMCGTSVPAHIHTLFSGLEDEPELHRLRAIDVAFAQCEDLVKAGAKSLHFYTLNRADLVMPVCQLLGIAAPKSAS